MEMTNANSQLTQKMIDDFIEEYGRRDQKNDAAGLSEMFAQDATVTRNSLTVHGRQKIREMYESMIDLPSAHKPPEFQFKLTSSSPLDDGSGTLLEVQLVTAADTSQVLGEASIILVLEREQVLIKSINFEET